MFFIYFAMIAVSLLASVIGAVCGIGGGVVIKPVLDSLGVLSVETVGFLSGLTVLFMSSYSTIQAIYSKDSCVDRKTSIPVSIGAAAGGIIGNQLFHLLKAAFIDIDFIGSIQAAGLFVLTFGTLLYTMNKRKIRTHHLSGGFVCGLAGLLLGVFSSFLGIGGGPFNLILLSYLFSMETKEAAQNSLIIIMFSQIANFTLTVITGKVPEYNTMLLIGMVCAGIFGGAIGRKINKKIDNAAVDRLFRWMIIVIMLICVYNIKKYMQS